MGYLDSLAWKEVVNFKDKDTRTIFKRSYLIDSS